MSNFGSLTAPRRDAAAIAWNGAALIACLALPCAVAAALDERTIAEASVWEKPLRFQVALTLHLLTLFILLRCLPAMQRARQALRGPVLTAAVCSVLEALYITLQSARGRGSHFNVATPLESFLYYGAMGPAAVAIVAGTLIVGWQIWRHGDAAVSDGVRSGAGLGLMLGSALTLIAAAPLSSGVVDGLGHWVGGVRSDAHGLPLFGWSRTGGDLRVPHFFATHLMQALPIVGWIADHLHAQRARSWVYAAATLGVALVFATLWQAASGHPFPF